VAVAVALAALGVQGKTFEGGYPAIDITLGLLIGGVFLAAGLAVRSRPMHALLVAAGLAWLAEDLNTSDIPVVFWAGLLLRQATAGPLVHVILAHPDGRLPSRPARLAVTLAYAAGFGLPLLRLPITPLDASCRCPGNPFAITDLPALSTALDRLQLACFVAVILLAAQAMRARWQATDPTHRAEVGWVYGPALALGVISLADTVVRAVLPPQYPIELAQFVNGFSRLAMLALPAGFLIGVLRGEATLAATSRLATVLRERPAADELRAALAVALDDRDLALAVWDAGAGHYVGTRGGRLAPTGPDRVASEIRDGPCPLAVLVHDPALLRAPAALDAAATVVRIVLAEAAPPAPGAAVEHLSSREREVLALMSDGLTNRSIARHLQIGDRTVESHVSSIFRKLDLPAGERENRRVRAVLAFLGRQATE
jgi:DNA-binding CsgD family transcriptional regulator